MKNDVKSFLEKNQNLNFKIANNEFMGKGISNNPRVDFKFYSKGFDLDTIRSFSSYKKTKDDTSELEYYKKKCSVLEENLEELKLQNSTTNRSSFHFNDSSNFKLMEKIKSSSNKKTLTPLSQSINFDYKKNN